MQWKNTKERHVRRKTIILIVILMLLFFLFLLLSLSIPWVLRNYKNIGFDEIVFHLNMPLQGASIYVENYKKLVLFPTIGITVEVIVGLIIVRFFFVLIPKSKALISKAKRWIPFVIIPIFVLWAGILLYQGQIQFKLFDYATNLVETSKLIEEEYIDPREVNITFPEKKKILYKYLLNPARHQHRMLVVVGRCLKIIYQK